MKERIFNDLKVLEKVLKKELKDRTMTNKTN
jgi:hypothetical protein